MSFPPPPAGTVWELATTYWLSRCLHVATEIGVADALGPEPVRPDVLASSVGVNADALFRIVRLLAAHGVFEIKDGRIAHTPASEILRTDHPQSMRAFVRVMGVPIMWSAYGELEHAVRTGHSAVEKAVPEGFFGYMAANPNVAGIFDEAMMAASHAQIPAILGSYDFSRFKRIGDIAGGRGHLLKALLEKQPGASGVLFELPHVIAEAKGKLPDRIELVTGDFFKDKLPSCDAYLLKAILHDWDDNSARKILRAIRMASPAHATILILETIMPDQPGPHWAKLLDIQMLTMHTGRERTRAEYATLLAEEKFRLERVIETSSDVQILEAIPV
jgi:hypothetical protein